MTPIAATIPLEPLSPVPNGAAISVLSPASFAKPERVERGLQRLRTLGFVPRLGANTQKRGPLFLCRYSRRTTCRFSRRLRRP
jgi:muramoyltetrapeptide carboxypeptidase LdcA involved in peptidoglycan recycling